MAKTPEIDLRKASKNYFINGDMRIAQRGTSFAAIANQAYTVDRFQYIKVGAMVHTVSQDTDVPTVAQAGYLFQNSLRANLTTPDTAIAATDYCAIGQIIEGYNWVNLAQKTFTISFWVKATLPGIYNIGLQNSTADRGYAAEYTINVANTWEYKTVVIAASPSAGTWNYTNGAGIKVWWTLASGSNFNVATGSWASQTVLGSPNQVNGVNTGATDFRITGVMINEGIGAPSFRTFGVDIESELSAAQRYYEKSYNLNINPTSNSQLGVISVTNSDNAGSRSVYVGVIYKVRKRTSATPIFYNPVTGALGARGSDGPSLTVTDIGGGESSGYGRIDNISALATGSVHFVAETELS